MQVWTWNFGSVSGNGGRCLVDVLFAGSEMERIRF